MRLFLFSVIITVSALAQTPLTTPVTILPNAAHTAGGEVRIWNSSKTLFGSIGVGIAGLTLQAPNQAAGNIILTPGNTGPGSSVLVIATRLDTPSFAVIDAVGTTTSNSIEAATNGGVVYFSVAGGTASSDAGLVTQKRFISSFSNNIHGSAIAQAGSAEALGVINSGSGIGIAINTGAGDGMQITSSSGVALHIGTGGITDNGFAGGGTVAVCANNSGHFVVAGCNSVPGAWSSFTPSTSNLTSVLASGSYSQFGKTVSFRAQISGTSNGSVPTITLPLSPITVTQVMSCIVATSGATIPCSGLTIGSAIIPTIYNNSSYGNGVSYTFDVGGVYETP